MVIVRDIPIGVDKTGELQTPVKPGDSHPVGIFLCRKDVLHPAVDPVNHDVGPADPLVVAAPACRCRHGTGKLSLGGIVHNVIVERVVKQRSRGVCPASSITLEIVKIKTVGIETHFFGADPI